MQATTDGLNWSWTTSFFVACAHRSVDVGRGAIALSMGC